MTAIKRTVDGANDKYVHPMSGYNNCYDYLEVNIDIQELENGKFRADVRETVWHGGEVDEGCELECDRSDESIFSSPEFDTTDEAIAWTENEDNVTCEYEG